MFIAIDGGTTNTRLALYDGSKILRTVKKFVGARDTAISGSNESLESAVKEGINELLNTYGISSEKIEVILASGMICSDMGLYSIEHIKVPADAKKIAENSVLVSLKNITEIPFVFIPGVKNDCDYTDPSSISKMDVMRGEETEIIGIMKLLDAKGPVIGVLPGSHTKIVEINKNNEIASCYTSLAGEMIRAISENTILKNSLGNDFVLKVDKEYLYKGFDYCEEHGLNTALFKIRMMSNYLNLSHMEMYSFLFGAVLKDDIKLIMNCYLGTKVLIGGSNPFREAFAILLKRFIDSANIVELSDEVVKLCTTVGAAAVYNER
ncbi:MAG: 2-dehydro-3-deoxygalactonokinase [Bacillota bacterium]|nr:2-dehydro-3-deoxygalactonokinase [Bacillota bacterium]